jgi:hypothetical protein
MAGASGSGGVSRAVEETRKNIPAEACERTKLLEEHVRAHTAASAVRPVRARKLLLRAVAEARALLLPDSLILADLLDLETHFFQMSLDPVAPLPMDSSGSYDVHNAMLAWREDPEHTLEPSRECLALLQRRYAAGTLFEPSLEEYAWFFSVDSAAGQRYGGGACLFLSSASMAVTCWPQPLRSSEEAVAGLRSALRVMMQVQAQGFIARCEAMDHQCDSSAFGYRLQASTMATCALLPQHIALTRATCDVTGMRLLHALVDEDAGFEKMGRERMTFFDAQSAQLAAADAARYGIQRCALSACAAAEPHARAFKRCSRCRVVAYCCPEHQAADWKRHKRAECAPKPQPPDADADGAGASGST